MSRRKQSKEEQIRGATRFLLLLLLLVFLVGVYLLWVWLSNELRPEALSFLLIISVLFIPVWLVVGYQIGKHRSLMRIIDLALPDILEYKLGTKFRPGEGQTTQAPASYPALSHVSEVNNTSVIDL